jgi:hypothetical protein
MKGLSGDLKTPLIVFQREVLLEPDSLFDFAYLLLGDCGFAAIFYKLVLLF